jgi:ethanolamine utilization protein EutM
MSGQSLGLIEAVGLTVAMEAADAAMKSANVELIGYELSKGGGLVTLKFAGEVGAMNAAVAAGVAAASKIGSIYAWKVIARTASGIDKLIASKENCGVTQPEPVASVPEAAPANEQTAPVIPVVNIDPAPASTSCADIAARTLSAPAEVASPVETPTITAASPQIAEGKVKPAKQTTPDGRKPLRVKAKGARK